MQFLVFIAIIVGIWYGMRWLQNAGASQPGGRGDPQRSRDAQRARAMPRATDMTACPRCGSFVPSDFPASCGRRDCPYPGVG